MPNTQWKCTVCGYIHEGDAPETCPVCGVDPDMFEKIERDDSADPLEPPDLGT